MYFVLICQNTVLFTVHALHFNLYMKVLFWNVPYYFNRVFSERSPALTEQYLRWWGITYGNIKRSSPSFLELEHTTEDRETPSGEHHCGTRKHGNTNLPTSGRNPAVVRCCNCRPRPFFCAECDVSMHTRHVLHNRDAMTPGFYQPLPPTTFVVDKGLSHCGKLWVYNIHIILKIVRPHKLY